MMLIMKFILIITALFFTLFQGVSVWAKGPNADSQKQIARKIIIHKMLLSVYISQNRVKDAINEFSILASLEPSNSKIIFHFSVYLYANNRKEEGYWQLSRAISLSPKNTIYQDTYEKWRNNDKFQLLDPPIKDYDKQKRLELENNTKSNYSEKNKV